MGLQSAELQQSPTKVLSFWLPNKMIDFTNETLFVLQDCLKRLLKELPVPFSQLPVLLATCSDVHYMKIEEIQATWRDTLYGNKVLAGLVGLGVGRVLSRVKVELAVLGEMRKLQDMAETMAVGANLISASSNSPPIPMLMSPLSVPSHLFPPTLAARALNKAEDPLKLLYKARGGQQSHPSLGHMRSTLFRGLQRSILDFSSRKHCPSGLSIDPTDESQILSIENLRNHYETHKAVLEGWERTSNCPYIYTGEYRHYTEAKVPGNAYCQLLLASEAMHGYYLLYLEVVFGTKDCRLVCRRLKARCCLEQRHTQDCEKVWTQVWEFAKRRLLEGQESDLSFQGLK